MLLLLGAAGAGAIWYTRQEGAPVAPSPSVPVVHVVAPQPTTFYRWFDTLGSVVPGRDDTLSFAAAGKVQDVMPPGTTFSAGETVARLQGVAARELAVNKLRARVAFYEQLRDSSRAAGNEAAAHQAEVSLAARTRDLIDAHAKLTELEIRPSAAGEIAQVLVDRGTQVKAGVPVFRVRATGPRATFALPAADLSRARGLGFCRLETVPGTGGGAGGAGGPAEKAVRALDCALTAASPTGAATAAASAPAAGETASFGVDLVGAAGVAPGTQVRLASARFDGVFPVPRSALVHDASTDKGIDRVWIFSATTNTAESRAVELTATVDDLALVSRGVSAGDSVIIDPPAWLPNRGPVTVAR